ncbi:hypothetical protein [Parvularcula dongshanensis]|uniref:Uncharacterized protein n=1 Tax=Parvularcula dongshanensis TaxID=1173995 RepID=A0A840I192_9PROT|nr:hypothetical protein [Parvularcula dongshanensis]MBB4658004.1 hypothetical protein [Parvularcula dongshanensis]
MIRSFSSPDATFLKAPARRYLARLSGVMALYFAALFAINLIPSEDWPVLFRGLFVLTPALAAVLIVPVVLDLVRSRDEVQQRIFTEACLVSLMIVGLGSFAYAFLVDAFGWPQPSLYWVWPALIGVTGAAQCVIKLRYR